MAGETSNTYPSYDIKDFFNIKNKLIQFDIDNIEETVYGQDLKVRKSHGHNFFSLFFIIKGYGKHLIDFVEYDIKPKRIFFLVPGQIHKWKNPRKIKGHAIIFTEQFFVIYSKQESIRDEFPFLYSIHWPPYIDLTESAFNVIMQIVNTLYSEYRAGKEFNNEIISAELVYLLYLIKREVHKSTDATNIENQILKKFQVLIEKEYCKIQSVVGYAEMLNITRDHLDHLCRKYKGVSPGIIIKERILLEAKRLLIHSDLSISEISYKLGFEDPSYFTRLFKQYTKYTPTDFKKHLQF